MMGTRKALACLTLLAVAGIMGSSAAAPIAGPPHYGAEKFYFAEGTTLPGFLSFLLFVNTGDQPASVVAELVSTGGASFKRTLAVPPAARVTLNVEAITGRGHDGVAAVVTADRPVSAERAVYFERALPIGDVTGSHVEAGVAQARPLWAFAEGSTLEGFQEYLTLLNPDSGAAVAELNFGLEGGGTRRAAVAIPGRQRVTVDVAAVLGPGVVGHSTEVKGDRALVVERPMYFRRAVSDDGVVVDGGDVAAGVVPGREWYFAEGTLLPGFATYLTIANLGAEAAQSTVEYLLANGETASRSLSIASRSRRTVKVFDANDPGGLGRAAGDPETGGVSIKVSSDSPGGIVVERPIYFHRQFDAGGSMVNDGSVKPGAHAPAKGWVFAEGSTLPGLRTFVTVMNPTDETTLVNLRYVKNGDWFTHEKIAKPRSRVTVDVSQPENGGFGEGQDGFGLVVSAGVPIVVERPTYFDSIAGLPRASGGSTAFGFVPAPGGVDPDGTGDDKPVPPKKPPAVVPTGTCSEQSWTAGSVELCNGVLVYRDYVNDDYGANNPTRPGGTNGATGGLGTPMGDARYPAGSENTADLVALRLAVLGNEVEATFELNTLYATTSTIAALAVDRDGDSKTGGGPWPDLGVSSTGWESIHKFAGGDVAANRIVGRFPLPAAPEWRVQALVAQSNGTVMNVAFRGTDEKTVTGNWFEDNQATALQSGDISAFAAKVRTSDLTSGVTRRAPIPSGFQQRVYRSQYALAPGEGISLSGVPGRHGDTDRLCEQYFHYLGRFQGYAVYVPGAGGGAGSALGKFGVQLVLHGCNAVHASLVDQPGMQARFGDELGRILVSPLGRGPVGFYSDISERDVLDVLADVEASFSIDTDRIFTGGYSMGGYGAYRFAMLYPDRFAGFTSWVGFTGDAFNNPVTGPGSGAPVGAIGNVIEFVRNLRHVPASMLYAGADELVPVTSAEAMRMAFGATDDQYTYYLHPAAEHVTFAVLDDWRKEAARSAPLRRVQSPARVTFRTDRSFGYPEYAIKHDRAYWVSQIVAKTDGHADTDLTSEGCGRSRPALAKSNGQGPDPLPWTSETQAVTGSTPGAANRRLTGTLGNVTSLSVDVVGSCLGGGPVSYEISTTQPATISLSDGRQIVLPIAGVHQGSI